MYSWLFDTIPSQKKSLSLYNSRERGEREKKVRGKMDVRKIVVVVEDVDVAKTALQWTLHNLLRYGDLLTLLHVFSPTKSRSKKKARLLRLQGYQLALSFKEICNSNFFNVSQLNFLSWEIK